MAPSQQSSGAAAAAAAAAACAALPAASCAAPDVMQPPVCAVHEKVPLKDASAAALSQPRYLPVVTAAAFPTVC